MGERGIGGMGNRGWEGKREKGNGGWEVEWRLRRKEGGKGRWEWRGREGGRKRKVGVEGREGGVDEKVKRGLLKTFYFGQLLNILKNIKC